MNRFAISTPEGTKDRVFSSCKIIRQTEKLITEVLKNRGYGEVITPTTEYYDVFLQSESSIGQETMLKLMDRNGRILVMRPDSTTPIARIASTKINEKLLPLRLYYTQSVFRSDVEGKGHNSEIMQVGAELIGADGMMADLDILSSAFEALKACGTDVFRIELGHAGIYKALISSMGVPFEEAEEIRMLIENKSFAALEDALAPYKNCAEYSAIKAMPQLFGGIEVLSEAEELTQNPKVLEATSYLRRIFTALDCAGFGEYVMIDLGLVHEMDYYTGIMFRGYMGGAGSTILSGGRYNSLCSKFGKNIPATGFAIDLDAVSQTVELEEEQGKKEIVYTTEDSLKVALDYIKQNNAVLSPFSTLAETEKMAKTQGFETIVTIMNDEILKEEVK